MRDAFQAAKALFSMCQPDHLSLTAELSLATETCSSHVGGSYNKGDLVATRVLFSEAGQHAATIST
jgi:hypothetical protein